MSLIQVSFELDSSELAFAESALTLALRRETRLQVSEAEKPKNCGDFIISLLKTGPKTKSEIKDYIESLGYARSGAGPTCSDLMKTGKIRRISRARYIFIK